MKKQSFILVLFAIFMASCQQDEILQTNTGETDQDLVTNENIEVKDGYLNFATEASFENFILSLESDSDTPSVSTRSGVCRFKGFTPIAELRKQIPSTRSSKGEEDEEMSVDEYNIMKAENLLIDPILTNIMDTTLRVGIEGRVYQVTEYGTFSASTANASFIKEAIAKFDVSQISSNKNGAYIDLPNGVTFTNTFGPGSSEESTLFPMDNEVVTRAAVADFHNGYNVNTYGWKNNSMWQKFWDAIRGKDVSKENNFSSTRRVQVNVFDINYAFYASAGIKVKMQKRKKIWFVKYWVSEDADKLAIGFNKVYGEMKYKNPRSFSAIAPTTSSSWGSFTGTLNGITSKFVFANYKKLDVVKDWVDDIFMFLPEITLVGNTYPNKDMMNKLYDTPADMVNSFLRSQTGRYVFEPIRKQIQPKDPRISYLVWGNSTTTYNKEKPYIMGVKEYGRGSSKTVRFDRSFGFSINNFSVSGFLPTEFDIDDIDAFGAAYYEGSWRGVRFVK